MAKIKTGDIVTTGDPFLDLVVLPNEIKKKNNDTFKLTKQLEESTKGKAIARPVYVNNQSTVDESLIGLTKDLGVKRTQGYTGPLKEVFVLTGPEKQQLKAAEAVSKAIYKNMKPLTQLVEDLVTAGEKEQAQFLANQLEELMTIGEYLKANTKKLVLLTPQGNL